MSFRSFSVGNTFAGDPSETGWPLIISRGVTNAEIGSVELDYQSLLLAESDPPKWQLEWPSYDGDEFFVHCVHSGEGMCEGWGTHNIGPGAQWVCIHTKVEYMCKLSTFSRPHLCTGQLSYSGNNVTAVCTCRVWWKFAVHGKFKIIRLMKFRKFNCHKSIWLWHFENKQALYTTER